MPAGSSSLAPKEIHPSRRVLARHKVVRRALLVASVLALLIAVAGGLAFSDSRNMVIPKFQIFENILVFGIGLLAGIRLRFLCKNETRCCE